MGTVARDSKQVSSSSVSRLCSKQQFGITFILDNNQLGFGMDNELSIDFILAGLLNSFAQFVLNYRMNDKETFIPELINLLKTVEPTLKKEGKAVLLMDSSGSKKSSKNKNKRNITKKKGGRPRRLPQRVFASIMVKRAIGREIVLGLWKHHRRLVNPR